MTRTTSWRSVGFLGRIPPPLVFGRRPIFFENFLPKRPKTVFLGVQKPAAGEKMGSKMGQGGGILLRNSTDHFQPVFPPLLPGRCFFDFFKAFSQSIMQNLFWRCMPDSVVYFFVFSVNFILGFGSFQWAWRLLFYFSDICR